MTNVNNLLQTLEDLIERVKHTGKAQYIDYSWQTLDASDLADDCRQIGYTVVNNYDTGHNGRCELSNGVVISTNGFICVLR